MNELMHYGTKGHSGRYPPGSGENPKTGPRSIYLRAKRAKNKAVTLLSKGKKSKKIEPPKKYLKKPTEEQKSRILNSGDIEQIKKYNKFLSNKDIEYALKRVEFDKQISQISAEEKAAQKGKALKRFEQMADKLDKTTASIDKVRQSYNRLAIINNSVSQNQLPIFEGNKPKSKKSTYEKNMERLSKALEAQQQLDNALNAEKKAKKVEKKIQKEVKKQNKKKKKKQEAPEYDYVDSLSYYYSKLGMNHADDSWPKLYSSAFEKKEKKTYPW